MHLSSYLERICFSGPCQASLDTLRRLQRGHLEHIAYENLDVQLGRRVTLAAEDAYGKMVRRRRGGWCFEMNGLFHWALAAAGFRVMPATGAVMRRERGQFAVGNHLALIVELDEPYLVDVGLGDGPVEPIPLREGSYQQGWRTLKLERLADGWWRFHNHAKAFASSMDFRHQPADWALLQQKSDWLQTSMESRFVQNAVCIRHLPNSIVVLLGRVLRTQDQGGVHGRLVTSAQEYADILATRFAVQAPEAADLWPRICARHAARFGAHGGGLE